MEPPQPPKGRGRGRGSRSSIESDGEASVRSGIQSSLGSLSSGSTMNLAPSSICGSLGTVTDVEMEDDGRSTPSSSIGRGKANVLRDSGVSGMKRKSGDVAYPEKGNNNTSFDVFMVLLFS